MSQENLSPGNCVAATVMSLTINVATVYPKEILLSGNTVARHGSVRIRRTLLLAFCCKQTYVLLFVIRTKETVFEEVQNNQFCREVLHDGVKLDLHVLRNI